MQYAIITLIFAIGALKAVKDTITHHFTHSIFPQQADWWRSLHTATLTNWFTDAWHTADWLLWVSMGVSICLATFVDFEWWYVPAGIAARGVGFHLFYNFLLLQPKYRNFNNII